MTTIRLPASQQPVEVPDPSTPDELDRVVASALTAHRSGSWSRDHRQRGRVLLAWADALEAEADSLVDQLVRETGKVVAEARIEIAGACEALRFNAGACRASRDEFHELSDGNRAVVRREPLGPVVFITPWNWPVLLLLRDLAPAFAAGVTAIVKPSSQTYPVTRRTIELGLAAGVPAEVLHLVAGEGEVGQALVEDPRTRGVAITGSTAAGQAVMRAAAGTMTRPLLELGGKATSLLLPGTALEGVLPVLGRASVITAGQMCMACTRVLVHRSQFDATVAALQDVLDDLVVGDPTDPATEVGPLIGEPAFTKVSGYLDRARDEKVLITGGDRVEVPGLDGYFLRPGLVAGADTASPLVQEDIFGPVLGVESYETPPEAVALANATPFGLAASVWGPDAALARAVADRIDAGTVWINQYNKSFPEIPSGGFKMSGLGRTRGAAGIDQFTEIKAVVDSAGAELVVDASAR
ncbi:MAG: aldehyde dehydrogenase family protein [Propionibacteriaceae bacterium]